MYSYLPKATTQVNYNIPALVWQAGRYKGTDIIVMNDYCQDDYRGSLSSYNAVGTVGYGQEVRVGKRKLQVKIDFTLRHAVPVGGTIQVVWPTSVTAAYPHCRSMSNYGSVLYAKGQTENGEIGCSVQSSRMWVVT